jgi:hypothetical protein
MRPVVLCAVCLFLFAAGAASAAGPQPEPRRSIAGTSHESASEPRISITAQGHVSTILAAIAARGHVNLVLPADTKTTVVVRLVDVPLDTAFETVAAEAGLAYRRIGAARVVATRDAMRRILEQLGATEVVPLQHASAGETADAVERSIPLLTAHALGSSVSITGAPEDLAEGRDLIRSLDTTRTGAGKPRLIVIRLKTLKSSAVAAMVRAIYPGIVAEPVTESTLILMAPGSP